MKKLIVVLFILATSLNVFSQQIKICREKYFLKKVEKAEEKEGVIMFKSDLETFEMPPEYLIEFGEKGPICLEQIENWTEDTVSISSFTYVNHGTYDLHKFKGVWSVDSSFGYVVIRGDTIQTHEDYFPLPPGFGVYQYILVEVKSAVEDSSSGNIQLETPTKESTIIFANGKRIFSTSDFPLVFDKCWIGAKRTYIEDVQSRFKCDLNVYPNPFRDLANIHFSLDLPGMVKMSLVDIMGRERWEKIKYFSSGEHTAQMQKLNIEKGIYFLILQQGRNSQVFRVIKI